MGKMLGRRKVIEYPKDASKSAIPVDRKQRKNDDPNFEYRDPRFEITIANKDTYTGIVNISKSINVAWKANGKTFRHWFF